MVSVIIPIYNTQFYLEKCIDSVINQTFHDLEIILVNDGSTDQSLEICQRYQEKDNRVFVIDQKNTGQGVARNQGINAARGEYIMFVDSDDWVDESIIEKLMDSLNKNNADISVCNLYRTVINEEKVAVKYEEVFYDECLDCKKDKNYVFNISSYPVAKLYKSELLKNTGFSFPGHFFEDVAAIPLLFAYAERISFIGEALYYYRNNSSSTINDLNKLGDRIKCLYSLVDIFKQHHFYDTYYNEMETYISRRLKVNYRRVRSVCNAYCNRFVKAQDSFYEEYFQQNLDMKRTKTMTWGSYNLYTVSKIIMNSDPDEILQEYYGFQSVISLMNKTNQDMNYIPVVSSNPFRTTGIVNDFTSRFLQKSIIEFSNIDVVLIDFLEERYDIGIINGNYFTLSDAFLETRTAKAMEYKVLPRISEDTTRLWKESCNKFIDLLMRYISPKKIVLVRMKLCEHYGVNHNGVSSKELVEHSGIEKIREINEILDEYYDYFMSRCPEAIQIDHLEEQDFYYTSQTFRHGCYPWHMNQRAYTKISEIILEKLCG